MSSTKQVLDLVETDPNRKLDLRSKDRYLKKALLMPSEILSHNSSLPDLSDQIEESTEPQLALGTFDAETLARVQASFPYLKYGK
jgi:hypothetical protein